MKARHSVSTRNFNENLTHTSAHYSRAAFLKCVFCAENIIKLANILLLCVHYIYSWFTLLFTVDIKCLFMYWIRSLAEWINQLVNLQHLRLLYFCLTFYSRYAPFQCKQHHKNKYQNHLRILIQLHWFLVVNIRQN